MFQLCNADKLPAIDTDTHIATSSEEWTQAGITQPAAGELANFNLTVLGGCLLMVSK